MSTPSKPEDNWQEGPGDGWWRSADGNWYPAEDRPGKQPEPAPPPPPPPDPARQNRPESTLPEPPASQSAAPDSQGEPRVAVPDRIAALSKLGDLHEKGLLSDAEFAAAKAEMLPDASPGKGPGPGRSAVRRDPSLRRFRVSKLVPLALSAVIAAAYVIWPQQIVVFGIAAAVVVVLAGVLVRSGEKMLAVVVACLVPVLFVADWAQQNREMQHLIDATFETENAMERFGERFELAVDVLAAKEQTESAWETFERDLNRAAGDQLEEVLVGRQGVDDVLILPWHRDLAAAQDSMLTHISEWEKSLEDWATWNWEDDFPSDNPRINSSFRIAELDYLDAVTIFPFPGIEKDIVDIFDE